MQFLNCKKDEDTTVSFNATVANSSEGTVDFTSGDYDIGSSITITATPKTGYVFSNWINTSTNQTYTTNPLSITINENTNLVANFEKAAYNVMFTISGQGSVQKEVVGGGGFSHGSQVKLTATPSDNYSFFYWNNDPGDTENPKTITLEGDQNIPTKFDYQVARDLVGNWEFEIGNPTSKNVTTIKMSIDIFLNVLMTTIVNGEVISQIFTQMVAISPSAIVIGEFAVITDVVVASATSLSMNMIPIPEDTAPPTNESEIPVTGKELNLSGSKSEEEPQTDEDGIIIPPTDAVTASSTTQDMGDLFDESFDKLVNEADQTATNTSTVEEGSFLDRVNGKTFTTETNDYTAVFEFTNDIQGEFIKFHMIYDDCGETLINGSNIVAVTRNTENEFWFTFSINSENNSTARSGKILAEARITLEDTFPQNGDPDYNDLAFNVSILFPSDEENSEGVKVTLSVNAIADGAIDYSRLIIGNQCNATEINADEVSGLRLIEQSVCPGESVEPYELVFKKQGFDRFINTSCDVLDCSGNSRSFVVPRLVGVIVNYTDGGNLLEEVGGTGVNKYGIIYKCSNEASGINSDQDFIDCDISGGDFGGENQLSFKYSGAVTDTTVSSIIHRIAYGNDEIRFVTNIKSESECNSSTTDSSNTNTTDNTTSGSDNSSSSTDNQTPPPTIDNTGSSTSTTDSSCSINTTLTSDTGSDNQSVNIGLAITNIVYDITSDCTRVIHLVSSSGLPTGVSASIVGNELKISGTPTAGSSGTFNYSITLDNHLEETTTAPYVAATVSKVVNGTITVVAATSTADTTDSSCSLDATLQSGSSDNQTINEGDSLNEIVYDIVTDCTRVIHLVSSSGLPTGVSASIVGNELKISGTPTAGSSGTFNYSITLDNHLEETTTAPYVAATVSKVVNGTITVVAAISAETYEINVTANSATNYILNGTDRNGSVTGNDPSVTVNVGDTLNFIVNAPGHPFYLKTVQGSGTANQIDGVTNAGTTNGTVSWTPTTAGTYYYQCAPHNSMSGIITVN